MWVDIENIRMTINYTPKGRTIETELSHPNGLKLVHNR